MRLSFPFDPTERAAETERLVMRDGKRLYYRFRPAPYYGGIATADAIGCSFLCAYCWNYNRNLNPQRFDKFYSAREVASRLLKIAHKKFFHLFRITGSEPLLGENSFHHFLKVITHIFQEKPRSTFILETNGFFLGYRKDLIENLKFPNLWIRIALKGIDEDTFQNITGAKKEFFLHPIMALKELEKQKIKAWPAIMEDLFTENEIGGLRKFLHEFSIKAQLELEYLEKYPFVLENMQERNIKIKG